MKSFLLPASLWLLPVTGFAAESFTATGEFTHHWIGYAIIVLFSFAYLLVIFEEQLHLHKSKPVLLAAGLIWILIAYGYNSIGRSHEVEHLIRHNFLEYTELFFFLLVAMTYINAMIERGVFDELRNWLVKNRFSYRTLFWLTGLLAFFISPIADNLTTALIMCAVVMAVGKDKPGFVSLSCINIVVAANAGGAFSPFGDITTLMVWQKGVIPFWTFFSLFVPATVNFLIPALLMQLALPKGKPEEISTDTGKIKVGGYVVVLLFLATIVTAVCFHNFLHIPPVFGMMTGLAYLKLYDHYLRQKSKTWDKSSTSEAGDFNPYHFDVFKKIAQAEWDTLFFFYGVIMCVGGLGTVGYLGMVSGYIYGDLGTTTANVLVGVLSAVVDNIPIMFSVLTMNPSMPEYQWLLVTLTAGVGGSLLSIGSAAGVALMGQARGYYTFFGHLKWMPAIALGYGASIWVHLLINT
ncbi:MAG: sodium:proton antiporter NhaD [Ketobacteraceae bacterium]|nr:sodium:proton antiporter NhaD [Ketobacteraceae bacterium]